MTVSIQTMKIASIVHILWSIARHCNRSNISSIEVMSQSPALLFHVCLAEPYVDWNTEAKDGELNSSGLPSFDHGHRVFVSEFEWSSFTCNNHSLWTRSLCELLSIHPSWPCSIHFFQPGRAHCNDIHSSLADRWLVIRSISEFSRAPTSDQWPSSFYSLCFHIFSYLSIVSICRGDRFFRVFVSVLVRIIEESLSWWWTVY